MRGIVNSHHILLDVVFILSGRANTAISMVVDTGYVGTLTLPSHTVALLGLPFLRRMPAKLADGSSITIGVHLATVRWHGTEQRTEVIALDDRPLLGMLMLAGSHMNVEFQDGGRMHLHEMA